MKRLRWPEILTGALLAIAVFAVGYSVSSFRYSPSSETTYGKDHDIANFADVFVAIWDYLTKDAITLFTLVLAVSTVWLAASTRGLWRETLATRKLAAEIHSNEERPWLSLELVRVEQLLEPNNRADLHVIWSAQNTGKTPAIDVTAFAVLTRVNLHDPQIHESLLAFVFDSLSEEIRTRAPQVVFPQQLFTSPNDFPLRVMEDPEGEFPTPEAVGHIYRLMVCLTYRRPMVETQVFHTAFVYRVNMDVFGNFFEMTLPAVNPELHPIRLGVSDIA